KGFGSAILTYTITDQLKKGEKMFRKLATLLLIALSATEIFAQSSATRSIYSSIRGETYETKADTTTHAFIESFMVKDKGYFNVSYKHYAFNAYWTQAHAIDVVVYAYERYKNINRTLANRYLNYIKLWYKNKANNYAGAAASTTTTPNTTRDYKMFENPYTDDMCWITLTLLHISEATNTKSYATVARQVFDNYIITRANEDEETGGLKLPWHTNGGGEGPNACTQSPATLIAAKLHKLYGSETNTKYLEYAKKLYAYTSKKIVKSDGRVEEPPLTYTQGTFGEACRILYHITDESSTIKNKYKTAAWTYLNYAFTSGRCTNGSNILRDEGSSGDQSIFKAILIPYAVNFVLDEDMPAQNRINLSKLIQKNTQTLWKNLDTSRYPIIFMNYFWGTKWTGADEDASMGAACSGASLIENTARMYRVITNRYELGTLYKECSSLVIEPGHEDDAVYAEFLSAMATAKAMNDEPGEYMIYEFAEAIEALKAAYQKALEYATGIEEIYNSPFVLDKNVYDLQGRKVENSKWENGKLPAGIYVIGGRKVYLR
ncbi:MAG: hypothetical protein II279_01085, partial [Bacteroidaceae bacterium]|nr:hypothetical protein [Bacteroidaceae bacterium]